MSMMKELAYRSECIAVCIVCESPTDEMREPFGITLPSCSECGESALYTVAELLEYPDYYGYGIADVLADLGF